MTISEIIHQQNHGYKNGHQLLASSIKLPIQDQDLIDRLSDISGSLRPGEVFEPYLTAYPLPSGKYYVVARTWQDLQAPRLGCVLTHSVIIPMVVWEKSDNILDFIALLQRVSRENISLPSLELITLDQVLPLVEDTRLPELVEALFLEQRQPIIMFDSSDGGVISLRITTALWPGLRRNFSFCTYGLSPRSFSGREFDLLFAPNDVRSRFSNWPGRRIEAARSDYTPRHRWTISIVDEVFHSVRPNLIGFGQSGMAQLHHDGDESTLRLSLLWRELLEKAPTSPSAILGIFDILKSKNIPFSEVADVVWPIISSSFTKLKYNSPGETYEFLCNLLGKFPRSTLPIQLSKDTYSILVNLTKSHPREALAFLVNQDRSNKTVPMIVIAGIGDGFADSNDDYIIMQSIESVHEKTALRLVAFSKSYASAIIDLDRWNVNSSQYHQLIAILSTSDTRLRKRALRNVAPHLAKPEHADLLRPLLREIDSKMFIYLVLQLGRNTSFKAPDFDHLLVDAAFRLNILQTLREVILTFPETEFSNRFLLSTLPPNDHDLTWLLSSGLNISRQAAIINTIILHASGDFFKYIMPEEGQRLISILLSNPASYATSIVTLISYVDLNLSVCIKPLMEILPYLDHSIPSSVKSLLFTQLFSAAAADLDKVIIAVINKVYSGFDFSDLISFALDRHLGVDQFNHNIVLLDNQADRVRTNLLENIYEFSDWIISCNFDINEPAASSWACLLYDSSNVNRIGQIEASQSIVNYGLKRRDLPLSQLILVAFPIVYDELKISSPIANPFSFFNFEWDKCKSARKSLIEMYLTSSWNPIDFLVIAKKTGHFEYFLTDLLNRQNGRKYLKSIESSIKLLNNKTGAQLQKDLNKFLKGISKK